jgi:hypothetical protein
VNRLRNAFERIAGLRRLGELPIERLRCNINPVAEAQGFSGRSITAFPACRAFHRYLDEPAAGVDELSGWYREQVFDRRFWRHPKEEGGMATGSLARAVERLHRQQGLPWTGFETARRNLIEAGIRERVDHYFQLLESIRRDGFRSDLGPPIRCWAREGVYVLINGHHRVSALEALGHRTAPVEVLPLFRLRRAVRDGRRRWARARRPEGGR